MNALEQEILETWFVNHRTNLLLMDSLTEESLSFSTSKRGGGSVGYQLAHLYNIRFWKLEKMDKSLAADLTTIKAEDPKSLAMLREAHQVSAERMGSLLQNCMESGKLKGFKRGIVTFLGSFLSHEAHHRGNIILTLKLCDFKLTDELKYGIWDWGKI